MLRIRCKSFVCWGIIHAGLERKLEGETGNKSAIERVFNEQRSERASRRRAALVASPDLMSATAEKQAVRLSREECAKCLTSPKCLLQRLLLAVPPPGLSLLLSLLRAIELPTPPIQPIASLAVAFAVAKALWENAKCQPPI